MASNESISPSSKVKRPNYLSVVFIAGAVWLFLFSIMLMVEAINSFGFSLADYVINTTANPFIGLFIGLLATALFQSSSTSTTITVAAVASGTLSLQGAIPIILGANIGTTLTSTIVSMGYITKANEFRKAVAAGTIHDLFNILLVVFFFPIEMRYHVLENGSKFIASLLVPQSDFLLTPNISVFPNFEEIASWLVFYLGALGTLILAGLLLFACIKLISRLLYDILIGGTKKKFTTAIFSSTIRSFGWGLFITSVAQSSSLTTSLIVPLVATGKVKLKRAFQFVMGANIGTTITALLAAVFQTKVAIEVALVHLLFNLLGVLLFLSIPFLSRLVIFLADKMGQYTLRIRLIGLAYIVITFFLLPFTLIYISEGFEKKAEAHEISTEK